MNLILLINVNKIIKEYDENLDDFIDFKEIDKYRYLGLNYPFMAIFKDNVEKQDKEDVLLMLSYDKEMRLQYRYNAIHLKNSLKLKMYNIKKIVLKYDLFLDHLKKDLKINKNKLTFQNILAAITKITLLTGIRVGKISHYKAKGTIGLSTITYKNIIELNDDRLVLEFIGKKKVSYKYEINDQEILNVIKLLYNKKARPNDFLFVFNKRQITYIDINNYIKKIIGDDYVSGKDLRTLLANLVFLENILNLIRSGNKKLKLKKMITDSVAFVAKTLQNTKAVSKSSYVFALINEFLEDHQTNFKKLTKYKSSIELLLHIINEKMKD